MGPTECFPNPAGDNEEKPFTLLPPADRGEVLHEQLRYLMEHPRGCAEDCAECQRLRSVADLLMAAFR
ncbi:MAG TPA: hypothetical protein VFQ79_06010 [Bryobacteraceae bacterium]|nr:hypothetical protein [Bryobacteraceae bacterium]